MSLHASSVHVIEAASGQSILDFPAAEVEAAFRQQGCLLFRRFDVTEPTFRTFTEQFATRFVLDIGASKLHDTKPFGVTSAFVQKLQAETGGNEQELHQENGRWADIPDLLWFYCARPASDGGETKLADGIALWRALQSSTRSYFSTTKVRYTLRLPERQWRKALQLFFVSSLESINLRGVTMSFEDSAENELALSYVTSAVKNGRSAAAEVFANSLRGPYGGEVNAEDGTPLPEEVVDDVVRVHRELTEVVLLQPHDVLMIDNTRFVHGRKGFRDPARTVYSAMAMSRF